MVLGGTAFCAFVRHNHGTIVFIQGSLSRTGRSISSTSSRGGGSCSSCTLGEFLGRIPPLRAAVGWRSVGMLTKPRRNHHGSLDRLVIGAALSTATAGANRDRKAVEPRWRRWRGRGVIRTNFGMAATTVLVPFVHGKRTSKGMMMMIVVALVILFRHHFRRRIATVRLPGRGRG